MSTERALIISNLGPGDETFDSDVGSWNVTRAKRDCAAGKHKIWGVDIADLMRANASIEVSAAKVERMLADRERLLGSPPLIGAMENGVVYLIDGHHRMRALAALGCKEYRWYVIEEAAGKPYRLYFNGSRVAPWQAKKVAGHT